MDGGPPAPVRLGARDRRAALAAPNEAEGFVSRRVSIDGVKLHVRQRLGDGAALPCVLLHGLAVSLILTGPTTDPAAASSWGQARRLLRDLVHEDWRQTPILAADVRDAGPRRILKTLRYAVTDDVDAKFPSMRVPALLIRGSHDRIAPRSWLDRVAERIPGAQTRTVGGAAHNVVTTAGAETADAVRTFLAPVGPHFRIAP